MGVYPDEIMRLFLAPEHAGTPERANAAGKAVSFACGAFVEIILRISEEKLIEAAGFRSNGCGYMTAYAEGIAAGVNGLRLTDLSGGEPAAVMNGIEAPAERDGCREAVAEAFRAALSQYRAARISEFNGDDALICTCFGIGESRVRSVIRENMLDDPADVAVHCRAGAGCGSCRMIIEELIAEESGNL